MEIIAIISRLYPQDRLEDFKKGLSDDRVLAQDLLEAAAHHVDISAWRLMIGVDICCQALLHATKFSREVQEKVLVLHFEGKEPFHFSSDEELDKTKASRLTARSVLRPKHLTPRNLNPDQDPSRPSEGFRTKERAKQIAPPVGLGTSNRNKDGGFSPDPQPPL